MQAIGERSRMDRFTAVTDTFRAPLAAMAEWLGGCSHRRTSFPITLRTGVSLDGQQSMRAETYIVCMACGRHFAYDWTRMRIAGQLPAGAGGRSLQTGNRTGSASPAVNERSAPSVKANNWNKSVKSTWRVLARYLPQTIALTWASATDIQRPQDNRDAAPPMDSATHPVNSSGM